MANIEMVGSHADGEFLHAAEIKNWRHGLNGAGVLGHTFTLVVTGGDRVITYPAITGLVPDGSGGLSYFSVGAGSVTADAGEAAGPRLDVLVYDKSAAAVQLVKGVATAETGDVEECPMPALTDDQIMLARSRIEQSASTIATTAVKGRAIDVRRNRSTESKYKSSTQVKTTSTSFEDVTAAVGSTFSFPIAANEVVAVDWWIPLTFSSTGGAKWQVTGPAAPTAVEIAGETGANFLTDQQPGTRLFTAVTAFSTPFASAGSDGITTNATYLNAGPGSFIHIRALIRNGATPGDVVLQFAQNNATGTTTISAGAVQHVRRPMAA